MGLGPLGLYYSKNRWRQISMLQVTPTKQASCVCTNKVVLGGVWHSTPWNSLSIISLLQFNNIFLFFICIFLPQNCFIFYLKFLHPLLKPERGISAFTTQHHARPLHRCAHTKAVNDPNYDLRKTSITNIYVALIPSTVKVMRPRSIVLIGLDRHFPLFFFSLVVLISLMLLSKDCVLIVCLPLDYQFIFSQFWFDL